MALYILVCFHTLSIFGHHLSIKHFSAEMCSSKNITAEKLPSEAPPLVYKFVSELLLLCVIVSVCNHRLTPWCGGQRSL